MDYSVFELFESEVKDIMTRRYFLGIENKSFTNFGEILEGQYRGNSVILQKPVETECKPSRTDEVTVQCTK